MCFTAGLPAQETTVKAQPKTHAEFVTKLINFLEARAPIEPDEKEWLRKVLKGGCQCGLLKDRDEAEKCSEELFKSLDLPVTEEELSNMNEKQQRKFMLLSPLTMMQGGCPEHQ